MDNKSVLSSKKPYKKRGMLKTKLCSGQPGTQDSSAFAPRVAGTTGTCHYTQSEARDNSNRTCWGKSVSRKDSSIQDNIVGDLPSPHHPHFNFHTFLQKTRGIFMLNFFLFHITQLDLNHYVSQAVLELQILLPLPPSHVIILYRCHMPSYLLCHSLSVYMCMYVICVSVCVRVCEGVWW